MEYRKAPTSSIKTIGANINNNSHHYQHKKKRTAKRQQLPSKYRHIPAVIITDSNSNPHQIYRCESQEEHIPMKHLFAWRKKWTQWFSSCGSERVSHTHFNPITASIEVR
jgi:hypothetical protein